MTKKNLIIGFVIGLLIGLLALPILNNLKVSGGIGRLLQLMAFSMPVLSVLGLLTAGFIAKWLPIVIQVARFVLVGALNTLLDLGILNILISVSGASSGLQYSLFKGTSFTVAVLNSYFWNRYWTFESETKEQGKEFLQFAVVSVIGFVINVGAASFVVNILTKPSLLTPTAWANVGAIVATFCALTWNFIGYKFVVFKK